MSSPTHRRAKIAITLGPSTDGPRVLERLIEAGADVARLNFSHGSADDHRRRAKRLRRAAHKTGRSVALMADLQGPRFRVGRLPGGRIELEVGDRIEVVAGRAESREGTLPCAYAALASDVKRGDRILIDDGKVELRVSRVRDRSVFCKVVRRGTVTDHKGINLPGVNLSAAALTPKDRKDLEHAVAIGADWLAVSFVRSPKDVLLARRLLKKHGSDMPIMAKIERPEAIDCLEEILEVSDGLLVARGDLGVELPPERVPVLQKQIIELANSQGKPVMTATQMLESMRLSERPTRAEASDVANAVLDGSGCLLLTAETAAGRHPIAAVSMMARIINEAEASGRTHRASVLDEEMGISMATCRAGCRAAHDSRARYIVVFTETGFSAQLAARFRPETPILAFTPHATVSRRMEMLWGVRPHTLPTRKRMRRVIRDVDRALVKKGLARKGDVVLVLSGSLMGVPGTTNMALLHCVGDSQD